MRFARFGGDHRVESTATVMRRTARMGRHLLAPAVGAFALSALATASRLLGPFAVRGGIDEGVAQGDKGVVAWAALIFFMLLVVQYVAQRAAQYAVAWVGERFLVSMRSRVFDHLMRLDLAFFDGAKTGVLVSRMTSDIESLNAFVNEGAVVALTNLLTVLGVTIAMLIVDWRLTLAMLALILVLVGLSAIFQRRVARAYSKVRERIGRVLASLQEGIAGVRVVQAFTQERRQASAFHRVNERFFEANMEAARNISWYFPMVSLLRVVGLGVVLLLGGIRILDGDLTVGSLFAFLLLLDWFFQPIVNLANVYNLLQASVAALDKLFELLDRQPEVFERPGAFDLVEPVRGEVALSDIGFGYGDEPNVIDDISLTVAPGERLAVVGETGSGKSTMAKLLMRFYDPRQGAVTVDGADLRDLTFASRADSVVLIPQDDFLFNGTLGFNIRYGRPDASTEDVWRVLDAMDLADWVRSLPDGLDTEVRERGSRFSAGERQLVALARAFLVDPAVIVLDEATSNLDPETEVQVEEALQVLLRGRTAVVIAHRLRSAERADRVAVVDAGRVVAVAPHQELEASSPIYRELIEVWRRGLS